MKDRREKNNKVSYPLIAIVGPTASGKSALAMEIATKFNAEIICADSRTVYKGMDIGTAKPSPADRQLVKHHLLDVVYPGQSFNAAQFKALTLTTIEDIAKRGKLPLMVGGTGLYVDSVIFDYKFGSAADSNLREFLTKKTTPELISLYKQKELELLLNSNNRRHLIRSLELNGLINHPKRMRLNTLVVGITTEKEKLRERIRTRALAMIDAGIAREVAEIANTFGWDSEAMTASIYRIFKSVIQEQKPVAVALEEFVRSDMALAKRQMTWFKRNPNIVWSRDPEVLITKVEQFLAGQSLF